MNNGGAPTILAAASAPALAEVTRVAAAAADDVDRASRFPAEAVAALKEAKLLSCSLPVSCGGESYGIAQLAEIARAIGAACSSAGMVFAMHHTQALSLARHGSSGAVAEVTREIASNESLLASATTEITTGGDVGSSTCAIVIEGDEVSLEKNAPVISYGKYADYICATARRSPDSAKTDQVLLVCPSADTTLEQTSTWDVLGFRGTCSPGFLLNARTSRSHVIPVDYATIASATMLPTSHTLWASVWLGIADAAVLKARKAVRAAVRKAEGKSVPQAAHLAALTEVHQRFESTVAQAVQRFETFIESGSVEPTIGFTIAMNNLKLAASTEVVDIVIAALQIVGLNGYREDHPLSLGRQLRDAFAPQLMVSNDRIRQNNAQLVLAYRG
jgi:acyl-CoA dehydrogenase